VADAHNLAWKLAWVHRGLAPLSLLDTYEAERRSIAQYNAGVSLENAFRLLEVWIALGVDGDLEASKIRAESLLATAEGRTGVTQAIENQAEHFDQLGVQLGFSYNADTGVVLDDGSVRPEVANPVREYVPTTIPGSRLPHAQLHRGGEAISTLDLVTPGYFLLICNDSAWAHVALPTQWPLTRVVIGVDVTDEDGTWTSLSGIRHDGALLIRPDQHVAWRTQEGPSGDVDDLHEVLNSLMKEHS
jgi:2,4-dichlorophenol 6-monooxygenase